MWLFKKKEEKDSKYFELNEIVSAFDPTTVPNYNKHCTHIMLDEDYIREQRYCCFCFDISKNPIVQDTMSLIHKDKEHGQYLQVDDNWVETHTYKIIEADDWGVHCRR